MYGCEGWKTFHLAEHKTKNAVRFYLNSSIHTLYYERAPESDNNLIKDPNLYWGVTQTSDDESIRVIFITDSTC